MPSLAVRIQSPVPAPEAEETLNLFFFLYLGKELLVTQADLELTQAYFNFFFSEHKHNVP